MQFIIRFLCALALMFAVAHATTGYAAYIHGHVDDWILFRGEKAYQDGANTNNRILIITVTAGDNGALASIGYWQAREAGMNAAVQTIVGSSVTCTSDNATHNGHSIARVTCNNVYSYYMRLPDGNHDPTNKTCGGNGYGFDNYGCKSLTKLRLNKIPSLTAVDSSSTYSSWSDLVTTIKTIMSDMVPPNPSSSQWINVADFDGTDNPLDHQDHFAVSMAVNEFAADYNRLEYLTYCTNISVALGGCYEPINLQSDPKKIMHDAYRTTAVNFINSSPYNGSGGWGTFAENTYTADWIAWGNKTYSRSCVEGATCT